MGRRWTDAVAGVALALALGACDKERPAPPVEVVVAAAASLRAVLPEIAASYAKTHPGTQITATFGASGELRQQVVAGAPVDVVAFAGAAPVDDLVASGLAEAASRCVIAVNSLVLIGPKGCPRVTFARLARVAPGEKIAIGDPRSVPAGQYAKAALERLNEWDEVSPRLVYGSDVAAVLAYARRGEVAAAVVYKTELSGIADVDLLDELAPGLAPRAEVVIALVAGSRHRDAAEGFARELASDEARRVLEAHGFGPP
jgi:molybdate transport system substrate-binding protein